MLFASTLRSYGYSVDRLFELLQELRYVFQLFASTPRSYGYSVDCSVPDP
jgi:hypothetical protein